MKIPTFTAESRVRLEAPGKSFNVRKSPSQMAEFELASAAPAIELTKQALEFTNTLYKFEVETKTNEAIIGAKEELLNLQNELQNSENIFDVFKEDGTGLWETQSQEIYEKLRESIGTDKYALANFDNAFAQTELSTRFSLRDVINEKIIKRREAALETSNDQLVAKYSDPYGNFSQEEIAFNMAELDSMWQNAARHGFVNPDYVKAIKPKNLLEIAKNVAFGYAGRNPNLVFALGQNLDVLDQLANGELSEEEAKLVAAPLPNGQWALTTLSSIPREEATKILADVFTQANKFQKFRDEQIQRNEDAVTRNFGSLKLDVFSDNFDAGTRVNVDDFLSKYTLVPGIRDIIENNELEEFIETDDENVRTIDGNILRDAVLPLLRDQKQISLDEQNKLETLIETQTGDRATNFASTSVRSVVNHLEYLSTIGQLTTQNVIEVRGNLESADFKKFYDAAEAIEQTAEAELNASLNENITIIRGDLFAVDRDPINPEDQLANAAAQRVSTVLRKEVRDGLIKTEAQLITRAEELVSEEQKQYISNLKPIAQNIVLQINDNKFFKGSVSMQSTDPLGDLEKAKDKAIAENPSSAASIESRYYLFYSQLSKFVTRGVFR